MTEPAHLTETRVGVDAFGVDLSPRMVALLGRRTRNCVSRSAR
ncbi:hypothetical protein [Micromonospora sp. AP08]|nr:hypothetical protein [Micromonospora sp. AP08]